MFADDPAKVLSVRKSLVIASALSIGFALFVTTALHDPSAIYTTLILTAIFVILYELALRKMI